MRSINIIGLIALTAAVVYGQPTDGAQYWSVSAPDCSSLNETPATITNDAGTRIGYSCYVTGTFIWLAAGAGWTSAIRVAGPALGAIGVDYSFYDADGNPQSLDTTGVFDGSGDYVTFALYDNQPAEVKLIGATNNYPSYNETSTGSVYATFYCADADTCLNIKPQLIYSALPSIPWSLSVPITWDTELSNQWSAVGIDNGGTKKVSFVVYNEDTVAARFRINVYDSDGFLAGTGLTPVILPLEDLGGGALGEGGTYGALLRDVIPTLPAGPIKVLVDGGSTVSAVSVLQFDGPSGTSLQVAYDTAPGSAASAAVKRMQSARRARVGATPKRVFRTVRKK